MRASTVTAFVAAALVSSSSRADDALARAQRAYVDVDYARCREEVQRSLAGPADKAQRVDAWRLAGLCAAALGDGETAREAFKRMLAIDKDARLPDGLSPRFTSAYREAKGSLVGSPPLAITVAAESVEGGTRTVRLKIVDELELVHKVGWRGAAGSSGGPFRKAPLLELELPAEADVTVFAVDAQGGQVATLSFASELARTREAPPVRPDEPPAEAAPLPWPLVGGVAAGVVVVGAVGVGLALALTPPSAVTVTTGVVFP